jgi:hypothetical protein
MKLIMNNVVFDGCGEGMVFRNLPPSAEAHLNNVSMRNISRAAFRVENSNLRQQIGVPPQVTDADLARAVEIAQNDDHKVAVSSIARLTSFATLGNAAVDLALKLVAIAKEL